MNQNRQDDRRPCDGGHKSDSRAVVPNDDFDINQTDLNLQNLEHHASEFKKIEPEFVQNSQG